MARAAIAEERVGLSTAEVARRRAAGQGNPPAPATTRSYLEIIRENVFTFVNNVLFALGVALVLVGRPLDALVSVGVVSLNILVSVVQEVRAKRTLDRITLLTRPKATVLRDGKAIDVPPEELVIGDVLQLEPGDQVVLDGRVLDGRVELDESLLTGESDTVVKKPGDTLYAGTFATAGRGLYEVVAVGESTLAGRITTGARTFRRVLTPLEKQVRLVVRILLAIMVLLQLLLALRAILLDVPAAEAIGNATVVASLVPNGLFLSIGIAYALASVRLVRSGLLVQQSNAIDSLSNVDTLVSDKTGTLTTNQLKVSGIQPAVGVSEESLKESLGIIAASSSTQNKTMRALAESFPAAAQPVLAEVPFSSARRWSGIATSTSVLALGAPEALGPNLQSEEPSLDQLARSWQGQGLRVLMLASGTERGALGGDGAAAGPPPGMRALGLVAISDELRPAVAETVGSFLAAGVKLKIISGDNPDTVAALARRAGLQGDLATASGAELEGLDGAALADLADKVTVFGRIGPQDKDRLVAALQSRSHYVAMVGDGVNDVLALKRANLAVAMYGGSQAARGVADLVLLDNSFQSLVPAVGEGQRIRNGMQSILKLYLTRIGTVASLIVASLAIGLFPLEVRNGSAVTLFSVGLPTLALTVWARSGPVVESGLARDLGRFVLPAVILTSGIGLVVFYGVLFLEGGVPSPDTGQTAAQLARQVLAAVPFAQTAVTGFLVFCGLGLFVFVTPRGQDRRPLLAAIGLAALFLFVVMTPLREFFSLEPVKVTNVIVVAVAFAVWLLALTATWRWRLVDRYLDLPG
jgi:cation-transporting P-type ATPase E